MVETKKLVFKNKNKSTHNLGDSTVSVSGNTEEEITERKMWNI